MRHRSKSNFKGFFNGYPYAFNVVEEASSENNVDDVNEAACDQINTLLFDSLPFDPEEFGFKPNSEQMIYSDLQGNSFHRSPKTYGYWKFSKSDDTGNGMIMYIPNMLIGHIVLTSIGVLKRTDINESNKCPNNNELSGACQVCENEKKCNFEI
jgi:hypothetical protein